MRKLLTRGAVVAGMAAATVAVAGTPALAAKWHVQGGYDSGVSCEYAGYYGWLSHQWDDYSCNKEPNNNVWWLLVWY
jgi:hypothetical protein